MTKTNFSKVLSAELEGIEARAIEVETDVYVGLHSFSIVGLADKALSESKERINAALKNSGIKPPSRENKKIIVNLAPADIKKTGSQYDLPIALGYLLASQQLKPFDGLRKLFVGELALDGGVRPVSGVLNIARLARERGVRELFVPLENAAEAAIIPDLEVIPVEHLTQLIAHLEGRKRIAPQLGTHIDREQIIHPVDIGDVKGQAHAKRALMIAAAGGHNLLMVGPPGTGKTMLAQSLTSILPPLELEEIIEVSQIYSSAGLLKNQAYIAHRPFRSPHQTSSSVAIIGGGQTPRPGEISLAHRGVLFLDELPEFRRDLLEALRQPLESGKAIVTRIKSNLTFPAHFILVAAMNPCPCGYYGDSEKACQCSMNEILRYQKKISGPLLDRIDLQIHVPRTKIGELRSVQAGLSDEAKRIREQVLLARRKQRERLGIKRHVFTNAEMSSKDVDELVSLTADAEDFIKQIFDKSMISARGYYRILKTAQTIADVEGSAVVSKPHIAEAFNYRLREQAA
jgi:magnesium chelatase family protein